MQGGQAFCFSKCEGEIRIPPFLLLGKLAALVTTADPIYQAIKNNIQVGVVVHILRGRTRQVSLCEFKAS